MPVATPAPSTGEEQDTRARLLETAADLLWKRSFNSAGIDEICQLAKARRGSLYHFFPSKTDLAVAAIRDVWNRVRTEIFEPALADSGSGLEKLHRLTVAIDSFQRQAHEHGGVYLGCPFGSLGQEMAHQDERLQQTIDEVFEAHVDFFERLLEQAHDEGEVRPGDLRQRGRDLLAFLEGALLLAKVANRPDRFTECVGGLAVLAVGTGD